MPRLIRSGHQVVSLRRGTIKPYVDDPAWARTEQVTVNRAEADAAGTFAGLVRDLEPDVVIDMVCFTPESAVPLSSRSPSAPGPPQLPVPVS